MSTRRRVERVRYGDAPMTPDDPPAPRPYRPSNGTEGMIFMDCWCDRCERDRAFREDRGDSCPIAAAAMAYDIGDPGYPEEWIILTASDTPVCTAFAPVERNNR
jgi:hypothetical protein